jgi:signal transduction histidine kinase
MECGYGRVLGVVRGPVGDLAGLTLLGGVVLVGSRLAALGDPQARGPWPIGAVLLVVAVVALWWRREFPSPVLAVTAAMSVAYYLLGFAAGAEPLPFLVALYAAASEGHRLASWLSVPIAPVVIELTEIAGGHDLETGDLALVMVTLVAVAALGELSRARRAYVHEAEERARAAEHGRAEEAGRRVAEERLRIARELHDVLVHHLSLISIQSGAAIMRRRSRPEFADQALETIRAAAHEALDEVRTTLGVLRNDAADPAIGTNPVPALARLPVIVERANSADVRVELDVDGTPRDLPAPVEADAFRIVQEALTNAVRHARAQLVRIRIVHAPDGLIIEVCDDGHGEFEDSAARPGHGLSGMRERALLLGGQLEAGPLETGGFRVWARLPAAERP